MQQKPTNELDDLLENMQPEQLDDYLTRNRQYLAEKKGFYYFFKDTIEAKGIRLKDIYTQAGMSESYGGKLVTMEKHTTDRNRILCLCLAGHFTLLEINRALKLYGMPELYAKDPRDACIIVAVNNRIYDPYEVDDILAEHGFARVTKEMKM